ncbi:MAG: NF038120 family PEP-CTERM protein, partial [Telluria sp.]
FAFFAPVGNLDDFTYGRLQLSGLLTDGTTITTALDFPGQNANGEYMFRAAGLDRGFRDSEFRSLSFNACIFDAQLNCVNSRDNPASYQAQFALDNVQLDAVIPVPASFLLVGLGLGALALSRRRAKPSRSNNLQAQGI